MLASGSIGLVLMQVAPATSAIPFRTEPAVSTGRFIEVMFIVCALLAITMAVLYMARKKGWLNRLMHASSPASAQAGTIMVRSSKRISALTTVHVLVHGDNEFLVLESHRGATASIQRISASAESRERSS